MQELNENEIAKLVVDIAYKMHVKLGPGLLESVYEEIMFYELTKIGLLAERQKAVPVKWDNLLMEVGFRSDLIVGQKVIVELKSIEKVAPVHSKQTLTYLKLTGLKLGLLINFGEQYIKDGITRLANNMRDG